jgi:hypothetical protein
MPDVPRIEQGAMPIIARAVSYAVIPIRLFGWRGAPVTRGTAQAKPPAAPAQTALRRPPCRQSSRYRVLLVKEQADPLVMEALEYAEQVGERSAKPIH